MANNKDLILKNAIEVGGSTKVTIGDAPASGSATIAADDASTWSYDSVSFNTASQDATPCSAIFNNDGTKMYVLGESSDTVYQYSLSTAFDISTASYDSVSFSVSSQENQPREISFNNNGTKMYLIGNSSNIYQYSLSTAYDLSTISYDSVSFSVSTQASAPTSVTFKPDGTKFYVVDWTLDYIFQYSLSTAYDISTASYDNANLNASSNDTAGRSVAFNGDGTKLYYLGSNTSTIYQYSLSTGYDISTASYDSILLSVSTQELIPLSVVFNNDNTKMYIAGAAGDSIYQYSTGSPINTATLDTSTGNYFTHTSSADAEYRFSNVGDVQTFQLEVTGAVKGYELSGAAYDSVSFSVALQEASPLGLTFKPDGTKMYIAGNGNDRLYQYSLSTAFDLSTASYDSVIFDVSSQEGSPSGIIFNSDGTKFYVSGWANGGNIYQYSLSTAYTLSTASYDNVSLSVGAQDSVPLGMTFNNNGTKMFMVGNTGDRVYQYSLSTAFDLSTASYDSVDFSVLSQEANPREVVFNSTGTKMYTIGTQNNTVYQYSLSTAFDISTASYDSVDFSVVSQETSPSGMAFNTDGTKMYVVGYGNDSVHQYSIGSAYTITWDEDIEWSGGTAPDSPAANEKNLYTITTNDGGTTYFGVLSGANLS